MHSSSSARLLSGRFRAERGLVALYVASRLSQYAAVIFGPWCLGLFIDGLDARREPGDLAAAAVLVAGLSLGGIVFRFLAELLNTRLDAGLAFRASQAALRRFFSGALEALERFEPAYLSARVVADSRTLVALVLNTFVDSFAGLAQLAAALVLIRARSASLFFAALAVLPVCAFVFVLFRRSLAAVAEETKEAAARYSAANQQQCAGFLFLKLNGLLDRSGSFIEKHFRRALRGFLAYKGRCAAMEAIIGLVQVVATLVILVLGGRLVTAGELSLGSFTAIVASLGGMVGVVGSLVLAARVTMDARVSRSRLDEIVECRLEPSGAGRPAGPASVCVEGLRFAVAEGKCLFGGLDARFEKGRLYLVSGGTGSGKSTFLKLLLGAYGGYEGSIRLDGLELRSVDVERFRREQASYLPQSPLLFFESPEEILASGGDLAAAAAAARGLLPLLLKTDDPLGFMAERSRRGSGPLESRFSGGERQKIALAAACARGGGLLLLDEPTAAMEEECKVLVADHLRDLARDRIVVCATHDLGVFGQFAHEVIELG